MGTAVLLFSLHLDVKLCQAGQQRCDILIGLAQFLLVLRVLVLVAAQLFVALDFQTLILRHQFLNF